MRINETTERQYGYFIKAAVACGVNLTMMFVFELDKRQTTFLTKRNCGYGIVDFFAHTASTERVGIHPDVRQSVIFETMVKLDKEQVLVERCAARRKASLGRGQAAPVMQKAGEGGRAA